MYFSDNIEECSLGRQKQIECHWNIRDMSRKEEEECRETFFKVRMSDIEPDYLFSRIQTNSYLTLYVGTFSFRECYFFRVGGGGVGVIFIM